jgi:hypothetical protein
VQYKPLEVIEERELADTCRRPWYNQTLCEVNDSVVRLGVMHRPRAPQRTVMLMVETSGIVPTGD